MAVQTANQGRQQPTIVSGEVHCALTGKTINAEDAYWAPPLVTTRQLVGALMSNLIRTPGNLGHVLFEEQPNVPYHPAARAQLASRRTVEQLKLLLVLLVLAAVIMVPIFMIAMP